MKRQDSTKVILKVNGRPWTRVTDLRNAGPQDAVYVLDREDGTVTFGDGTHGQMPQVGNTIRISYRLGSAIAGNISKRITKAPEVRKFWLWLHPDQQAIGWGKRPC